MTNYSKSIPIGLLAARHIYCLKLLLVCSVLINVDGVLILKPYQPLRQQQVD